RRSQRPGDARPPAGRAARDHRAVRLVDDPDPLIGAGPRASTVWAEQAIFTSMTRLGKSGYHLVARSPGVSESDAITLATWSPSHGALIVDAANRTSVNFHPMPGGRYALSRTCEGPPEYSGRGGRQLYTHALILEKAKLQQACYQPFALYRDALAL